MKIRLLLASVLMTFSVFGQIVPSYVPTNGLVGWWPFNGNANDESGNGNHGTIFGAQASTDRFGSPNSAYKFTGVFIHPNQTWNEDGDHILVNGFDFLQNNAFTISTWVFEDTGFTSCCYNESFVNFGVSNVSIGRNPNVTGILMSVNPGTNFNCNYTILDSFQLQGQWKHYIMVYDNGTMNYYLNGNLVATNGCSSPPTVDTSHFSFARAFWIDAQNQLATSTRFNGKLDDIGVWNRALSQQEVSNLYNASSPSTSIPIINCPGAFISPNLSNGLVGWWPFCGDADDESGNGNNGTVNGATLTSDRFGNGNSAYEFDGASNYISVPHSTSLAIQNEITISCWILPDTVNSGLTRTIISKGLQSAYWNYGLSLSGLGLPIQGNNYPMYNATPFSVGALSAVQFDNWYNLVVSINETSNAMLIYINGVPYDTLYNINTGQVVSSFSGLIDPCCSQELNFGKNSGGQAFYNGVIDDIGIWNRALDSSEVAQLYNTGLCTQTIAGSCDTLIFNANITGFNPVTYANQVKVYPNPASDNLVIDCGTNYTGLNGYSIRITNLLGQTVYNSPVTAQITNIQLTPPTWVNGTYVVQFVHPNGTVVDTKRIIIQ